MFPQKLFQALLGTNAYIKTVYANNSTAKNLSLRIAAKEVFLVKLLSPLAIPVCAVVLSCCAVPLCADCINLVNEDDGRGVLLGHAEQLAHELRAITQVLLDELGTNHSQEGC